MFSLWATGCLLRCSLDQFSGFFLCVDALLGIKDLFKHYPAEMQSHKYAIIQKLRERVTDDDKLVRDAFYKLFEADVFPACIEVY